MKKRGEQRPKLAPKLRFKGFTNDWEQCKLGELGKDYSGLTGKTKKDFGHGESLYVPYKNIFNNHIVDVDNLEKVNVSSKQNKVKYGDIFFTISSEVPEEVGMSSVMRKDINNLYLNSFSFGLRPYENSELDMIFSSYLFRTLTFRKKMYILAQGISRYNISKANVMKLEIALPSVNEQKKIGRLLYKLDSMITLHTKKDEYLKRLKDAILLEMIPRKNMNKAKLYFNNEDWVETTLKSVLSIPKNERLEVTSPSQLLTVKLNLGGVQEGSNRETLKLGSTVYYKRFPGQFIYGKQNFFNGGFGIIGANLKNKGSSGDVPTLDISNINPHYLFLFLSRKYYYQDKERFSSGTGSKRIHEKTLLDFDIAIPSKKQQEKIVKLIKSLDKQIENNEHKISSLKLLKEKYLKDMFV